jgi:hypothetical protein
VARINTLIVDLVMCLECNGREWWLGLVVDISEGQETGAIVPAPENARKKLWGVVDRARK